VTTVRKNSTILPEDNQAGFVLMPANPHGDARQELTTKSEFVSAVQGNSQLTDTHQPKSVTVVRAADTGIKAPVYNITVANAHEYYANGILVSNCDTLRYIAATIFRHRYGLEVLQPDTYFYQSDTQQHYGASNNNSHKPIAGKIERRES
jgi:hypothetical protein